MTATVTAIRLHGIHATHRTKWLIVEILTCEGLVGVGECSDSSVFEDVLAETDSAFDLLAGVELTMNWAGAERSLNEWADAAAGPEIRFLRGTVMGGLVTAICDIVAQAEGKPLWKWLGGEEHGAIPLYANINRSAGRRRPNDFARLAANAVSDGFSTIKLAPFDGPPLPGTSIVETGLQHIRAIRDVVGGDVSVLVDVHFRLSHQQLEDIIPNLEELQISWLEDAVDARSERELAWLADSTSIRLAGGERITDAGVLSSVMASGYLDVLLLDPKYVGGPLRLQRLLKHVNDVTLTYHNPTGPIGTVAAAHMCALHPDFALLEYAYGEDVDRRNMVEPPEHVNGGAMALPTTPGLGVRLRRETLPHGSTVKELVARRA